MTGFIFLLVFLAVPFGLFVLYRKYQAKAERLEKEHAAAFMQQMATMKTAVPATASTPVSHTAPASTSASSPSAVDALSAGVPVREYECKTPILTAPEKLLYFLLRAAMPEHVILVKVRLSELLVVRAVHAANVSMFTELTRSMVDFAICSREMQLLAVVDIDVEVDAGSHSFKESTLQRAGVRYTRVSPQTFPKRDAIKEVVLAGVS